MRSYIHRPRAAAMSWQLPQLAQAYGLPKGGMPGPCKVAIIELGGVLNVSDLQTACSHWGCPPPTVVNPTSPFQPDPSGADGEVALDAQIVAFFGWWLTGQPPEITMVWDQTGTITAGIGTAQTSGAFATSISWGAPENEWGKADAAALSTAAWASVNAGVTVCAASGDNDYSDGEPGGAHVDLPASAPSVIGCSGTTKTVTSETCWNNGGGEGTGGGVSIYWPRPTWQTGAPQSNYKARVVGDVAADADPNTGYPICLYGQWEIIGGTSACAPLWSAIIGSAGQPLGFITPKLYENRATCFQQITIGNNGKFPATVCDGLGAPIGAKLVAILTSG